MTRRTLSKQRRPLIVADAARGGSNCGVVVDSGAYQAAAIVDAETIVGGQYSSDSDEGLGVTLDEVDVSSVCTTFRIPFRLISVRVMYACRLKYTVI